MGTILDTIVARKREEVKQLHSRGQVRPEGEIDPPRGFLKALTACEGLAVIGEAKKASPSKGVIREDFDPEAIAVSYRDGGVQAISVLTDESFFQGSLEYLPLVRRAVDLPVLRKDFIIDESQIRQSRLYGADAILLITAILDKMQMRDFLAMARGLGMDVLVEVHDEKELERALLIGSRLIGVNNRNLKDFSVDLRTTFRIKKELPDHIPLVSESGIHNRSDMQQLEEAGVCAVLIGETLMRAPDPAAALKELRGK